MPPVFKLAFRFMALRRPGLTRFTAAAAVLVIAAGTAVFVVASAASRGFEKELSRLLLENVPHIEVVRSDGLAIDEPEALIAAVSAVDGIETIVAAGLVTGLIVGPESSRIALVRTEPGYEGVEVGTQLARSIGAEADGEAELVVTGSTVEPRRTRIRVNRIFSTGLYELDSTMVRASGKEFAAMLGKKEVRPAALEIRLSEPRDAERTAEALRRMIDEEFEVREWQTANRALFEAIRLERRVAHLVVGLLAVLASLCIALSAALVGREHAADIAVLRTCGASRPMLAMLFVIQSAVIAAAGTLLGSALGLAASAAANRFDLLNLPSEVYSVGHVAAAPYVSDAVFAAAAAIMLSIAASLYPALSSAGSKPLEVLRNG